MIDSIIDKQFAHENLSENLSPVRNTLVFTDLKAEMLYWVEECALTGQYRVLDQYDLGGEK